MRGTKVTEAGSVAEALAKYKTGAFDLLIMISAFRTAAATN